VFRTARHRLGPAAPPGAPAVHRQRGSNSRARCGWCSGSGDGLMTSVRPRVRSGAISGIASRSARVSGPTVGNAGTFPMVSLPCRRSTRPAAYRGREERLSREILLNRRSPRPAAQRRSWLPRLSPPRAALGSRNGGISFLAAVRVIYRHAPKLTSPSALADAVGVATRTRHGRYAAHLKPDARVTVFCLSRAGTLKLVLSP